MSNFFSQPQLINFTIKDFNVDSDYKITLKNKLLNIILFCDHSEISKHLSNIFLELTNEVAGVNFCICDLIEERELAQVFTSLIDDRDSPYRKYGGNVTPFIIAYRDGKPQSIFKDVMTKSHILQYSLSLIKGGTGNYHSIDDNNDISKTLENEKESSLPTLVK